MVHLEGDVLITPYLGEVEQALEDRVTRLEDVAVYDEEKMEELEKLTNRAIQVANSVRNVKTKQLKEIRKLHAVEKALNRSMAK